VEVLENRLTPAVTLLVTGPGNAVAVDGVVTLREALLAANTNTTVNEAVHDGSGGTDSILFDTAGAFATPQTIPLGGTALTITDSVTITGPGADHLVVSGNHQSRIFRISSGATVAIAALTITDGMAVGDGGGILNTGSTLALDRVVLSNNQAVGVPGGNGRGGAIANVSGATINVSDCLFTQNLARGGDRGGGNGGAILNNASRLTVSHSTFLGNQGIAGAEGGSAQGGGINNAVGSIATVSESTFIGNRAIGGDGGVVTGAAAFEFIGGGLGGAIRSGNSTLTVEDSTFTGNQAIGGNGGRAASTARDYDISFGYGGGVFNFSGPAVVRRSTFTGNQAIGGSNGSAPFGRGHVGDGSGGGMINLDNATATVTDCTFDHNEARGGAGNAGGTSLTGGSGAFIVGWGLGGAITNEGWNRAGGTTLIASNLTLTHNRAVGGAGNTGNPLAGAGVGGGIASWWKSAVVTITDSTITHNQAIGGAGADGLGGGLATVLGSALTVVGCTVDKNLALGGDGADGMDGGDGLGGGVFNDAASSLRLERSAVTGNHANGGEGGEGGSDGEGIGGGVYNLGSFEFDAFTRIFKNHASTSDDDVFDPVA
jgi:hypothetical protein